MRSSNTPLSELNGLGLIYAELEKKAHQDLDWFMYGYNAVIQIFLESKLMDLNVEKSRSPA